MAVKRRLFWQIFPSHLLITLHGVGGRRLVCIQRHSDIFISNMTASDLEARARLFRSADQNVPFNRWMRQSDRPACKRNGQVIPSTRLTVILPTGQRCGRLPMKNPSKPWTTMRIVPEFFGALRENRGVTLRYSVTLDRMTLMYVAIPVRQEDTYPGRGQGFNPHQRQ